MIEQLDARALSFGAALVAGVLGSTHCWAMCGGFAGALGMRARANSSKPSRALIQMLATQFGRVVSYSVAGALAGGFGTALQASLHMTQIAPIMRALAGLVLVAIALRIAFAVNVLSFIERFGARLWSRLAPIARRAGAANGFGAAILLGAAWGWLPCGLVYSMLVYAALSGGIAAGATTMFAFGLGTLPAMTGGSLLVGEFTRALKLRGARLFAAGLLASFGALTLVMLIPTFHHHH